MRVLRQLADAEYLAAIVLLSVCPAAFAQQSSLYGGRPILFSSPKSDAISSNLNAMAADKSPLNRMDEELKKPFSLLDPESVTDPVRARLKPQLPPPKVDSKKVRELIDRQNNWVFLDPEEMDRLSKKAEEFFGGDKYDADGLPKKKLTAMENFWLRLEKEQRSATNDLRNSSAFFASDDKEDKSALHAFAAPGNTRGDSPNAVAGSGASSVWNNNAFAGAAQPGETLSFFSLPTTTPAERSELREAREARMQEFKSLFSSGPATAAPARSSAFDSYAKPAATVSGGAGSWFSPPATPGGFSSSFSSGASKPASVPSAFSTPSLTPTPLPVYQQPALPPPSLQMPRRSF